MRLNFRDRPRINIPLTGLDIAAEAAAGLVLIFIWALFIKNYSTLPEHVPTHFNYKGEADGFGDKSSLYIIPIIASILTIGMAILSRYPRLFNYPVKITEENAAYQYMLASRMIRVIKLAVLLVFLAILQTTIQYEDQEGLDFKKWLMPFLLLLIFAPVIVYLIMAFKKR